MKTALVLGAGGFIGSHMATRLKNEGYMVCGIDLKHTEFSKSDCDEFIIADLCYLDLLQTVGDSFDEVYQFAADMGGAAYIFSGENDANVMHNSALINLNVAKYVSKARCKLFYSSSACIYPQQIQGDPDNKGLKEHYAYPANPDSEYGYEKIFSERLYGAFKRNYKIDVRVARFHNIFGALSTFEGGKEKFPSAVCRKVAKAKDGETIEIWGDGLQTRSFLYIDECIEGVRRLMGSEYTEPLNIGSDERISINELAKMVIDISGKNLTIKNVESNALGVRGRNSDNELIEQVLNWRPTQKLKTGMIKLYAWIESQINIDDLSNFTEQTR